jgi:hypothetical protein
MVGVYKQGIKKYSQVYYELNKDRMKQNARKYYQDNRDKLLDKITCINCQGRYSLASVSTHLKTKKHLKSMQNELIAELARIERDDVNFIDEIFGNCFNISGNIKI